MDEKDRDKERALPAPQHGRRSTSASEYAEISASLAEILEALNGNPNRDIEGIRPRLRSTELEVKKLVRMVEQDKIPDRVKTLEDLIETMIAERVRYKAWIAGLAVGLGITTVTSLAGFVLQLIGISSGVP